MDKEIKEPEMCVLCEYKKRAIMNSKATQLLTMGIQRLSQKIAAVDSLVDWVTKNHAHNPQVAEILNILNLHKREK